MIVVGASICQPVYRIWFYNPRQKPLIPVVGYDQDGPRAGSWLVMQPCYWALIPPAFAITRMKKYPKLVRLSPSLR
jgi:hypothetical protein